MNQSTSDQYSLLVLSYPSFSNDGMEVVQKIRDRLDPDVSGYLPAHFTHLLPLDSSWERPLEMAAKETAEQFKVIEFEIKTLTILDDPDSGENFLVLIPKEYERLIELHLALYNRMGLPAPYGEDWKPHITVGASLDRELLIAEAKQLKAVVAGLTGMVDSIEVVKWQPGSIETISKLLLDQSQQPGAKRLRT